MFIELIYKTLPAQRRLVNAAQVHLSRGGVPTDRTDGLIVVQNADPGEVPYFLSKAPPRTALQTLRDVAFPRGHVEHVFRVAKSAIGFSPFEGRSDIGWMRPRILGQLVMTFVAEPTDRLRGEKPGDPARTSRPGPPPRLRAASIAAVRSRELTSRPPSSHTTKPETSPPKNHASNVAMTTHSAVVLTRRRRS